MDEKLHYFARLARKKPEEQPLPQQFTLYLNENLKIVLADIEIDINGEVKVKKNYLYQHGFVVVFFGKSGSGKTYSSCIIADQFPTVLYLDPTGAFYSDTLSQLGLKKEWKKYSISSEGKSVSINANEISKFCVSIWERKARSDKTSEATIRAINRFMKFPEHSRTFKTLKACFQEDRRASLNWDFFSKVVSKHDNAPSLMTYFTQKSVLEEENFTTYELPFFLYNLYSFRRKLKQKGILDSNPHLQAFMLFQDESQDAFRNENPTFDILDRFASQGRKNYVGTGWITPYWSGIPPCVRTQKSTMLVHQYDGTESAKLRMAGVDIYPEIFNEFEEYTCLLVSEPNQKVLYNNLPIPAERKIEGVNCKLNNYYKKFRIENKPKIRFRDLDRTLKNYRTVQNF